MTQSEKIPAIYSLSLRRQPERGGLVREKVSDPDQLLSKKNWRHLLILVHGFNNSETEAQTKYCAYLDILKPMMAKSRICPDAVALLHWPGNEAISPFKELDFAGYPVDVKRALQAALPFTDFLRELIATNPDGRQISFVGHSLGCRLLAEAICSLASGMGGHQSIATVCLMAAAIPVALAEPGKKIANLSVFSSKVLKAHSRSDWVLWLAFPVGQALAWAAGIEEAGYVEAVGRNGRPPEMGDAIACKGNRHGDYWEDEKLAARFLATIDPLLRSLPNPATLPIFELPSTEKVPLRNLVARELL